MRNFLYLWLIIAAAFVVTVAVVPGIEVDWEPGVYLFCALVIGLIDALLKPIANFLSLPLMLITFGLFAFVVNGAMLLLAAWILDPLDIDGLIPAMVGAVILAVATAGFEWFLGRFRVTERETDAMLEQITTLVVIPARDAALNVVGKVVNAVVAQVDMNALLAQVDVNAIIQQVDLNAVMGNVDLNSLMDNVDIAAMLEKVDIDAIMARTEMGSLIVRSTSGVAGEALDVVRSGAVGIDGAIGRTVDRVFRRKTNGNDPSTNGH